MRNVLLLAAWIGMLLPGCADPQDVNGAKGPDGVREFTIHVGWNDDRQSQYVTPSVIRVDQGDLVRFIVINDDQRDVDYNGDKSGRDNFHDLALNYPVCDRNPIEHEAPAGVKTRTECNGQDHFVASLKGEYILLCEVQTNPSHAALGMQARFIVE